MGGLANSRVRTRESDIDGCLGGTTDESDGTFIVFDPVVRCSGNGMTGQATSLLSSYQSSFLCYWLFGGSKKRLPWMLYFPI
jgi:hypothetical protein